MRIPRVYTATHLENDQVIDLDETVARYLSKVLRMQPGRPLILFNGEGGEYRASIHDLGKKHVSVKVEAFIDIDRQSPLAIHLGIGLSKGDRFEWVLQKATELGVSSITPLITERSEVKLNNERLEKKLAHWRQVTLSACEQCQLNVPPVLFQPARFEEWAASVNAEQKFVLHHRSEQRLDSMLKPESVALVIGPEGGLSDTEIEFSQSHSFTPLTLGPRVLRTETAPIAAIGVMQYLWGDLAN